LKFQFAGAEDHPNFEREAVIGRFRRDPSDLSVLIQPLRCHVNLPVYREYADLRGGLNALLCVIDHHMHPKGRTVAANPDLLREGIAAALERHDIQVS
jgi:hypothetical protein